jgi:hypothetical protein
MRTMTIRRRKISACVFFMIFALLICLVGCDSQKGAVVKPSGKQPDKEQSTPGVEAKFTEAKLNWTDEKGRKVMDASFNEARVSQTDVKSASALEDVKAVLYANGKASVELTAPVVNIDNASREIRASGGVKVVSKTEGASFEADTLVWKSRESKLIGSGNVLMIKKNITGKGDRLEADTALRHVRIN